MSAEDQDPILIQRNLVEMKLSFAVQVVINCLAFHPAQQSPFCRGHVTTLTPCDGICQLLVFIDVVVGIRPIQ